MEKTSSRYNLDLNDVLHVLKNLVIRSIPAITINLQTIADTGEIDFKKFCLGIAVSIAVKFLEYYATSNSNLPPVTPEQNG